MSTQSPIRLMVNRDSKEKSSCSLFNLKKLSQSLLDVRALTSSLPREESYQLPLLRPPRSEFQPKAVIIKRQREDLDATLPYSRTKPLEDFFPAARKGVEWKHTSQRMKITVSAAEPDTSFSNAETITFPALSQSFQADRRRSSKSPEKSLTFDHPLTPFSEVIEKQGDAKGAYPYLAVSRSKPRLSKTLSGPVSPSRCKDRTGPVSCTCSLRLYLTASLHYQQLFLRAAPSMAVAQYLPSLSLLYNNSKTNDKLVIAIVFDGVLGDWYKRCLYDNSPYMLRLRKKTVSGLKRLQQYFELIFISRMTRRLCLHVLGYFRNYGVEFQAAYRLSCKANGAERRSRQFLCYERLERDLGLKPTRILILTGVNLAHEDLSSDSLYHKQGSKCYLTAEYLPVAIPAQEGIPVACTVPVLEAQPANKIVDFEILTKVLIDYYSNCSGDWASGFRLESESQDLTLLSTPAVHQILMSQVLPQPRADAFHYPPAHTCSLHGRPAWGTGPSIHPFTSKLLLFTHSPTTTAIPGFDIIDSQSISPKSGFRTLLDYTTVS